MPRGTRTNMMLHYKYIPWRRDQYVWKVQYLHKSTHDYRIVFAIFYRLRDILP